MFEIGSYVIYRAEGVCVISDIREESFGAIGEKGMYYILTPVNDEKSTVFVPVDNEKLCSMMRKLLSASEIAQLCASVKDERMSLVPESRGRNLAFRDVLSIGDRRELIILVNTVTEFINTMIENGKKPTSTDENALRRAKRMLFDEFRATTDIRSDEDIIPVLRGELTLGNK